MAPTTEPYSALVYCPYSRGSGLQGNSITVTAVGKNRVKKEFVDYTDNIDGRDSYNSIKSYTINPNQLFIFQSQGFLDNTDVLVSSSSLDDLKIEVYYTDQNDVEKKRS